MKRRILRATTLAVACAFFYLMMFADAIAQYQTSAQAAAPTITENPVKKALKEGKVAIGATVTAANADVAATLAGVGFDFLWIESECSIGIDRTLRAVVKQRIGCSK